MAKYGYLRLIGRSAIHLHPIVGRSFGQFGKIYIYSFHECIILY